MSRGAALGALPDTGSSSIGLIDLPMPEKTPSCAVSLFCYIYNVTEMSVPLTKQVPWLLLVFSLPARSASQRVQIWRKLQRYGVLPMRSSGHVLPNSAANQERMEWLATTIRAYKGQASVVQVQGFDDLTPEHLKQLFVEARSRDYQKVLHAAKKV